MHILMILAVSLATAKTHKFKSIEDISLKILKLRPIIDETRT